MLLILNECIPLLPLCQIKLSKFQYLYSVAQMLVCSYTQSRLQRATQKFNNWNIISTFFFDSHTLFCSRHLFQAFFFSIFRFALRILLREAEYFLKTRMICITPTRIGKQNYSQIKKNSFYLLNSNKNETLSYHLSKLTYTS